MKITVNVSTRREELLGFAMAKLLKLKKNKNGKFMDADGDEHTYLGLGRTILQTTEETIGENEGQLQEWLKERYGDNCLKELEHQLFNH